MVFDRTATGARILVVDDDRDTRRLVRIALERSGYSVQEASSGAEALAMADQASFDLVVLDVMMPHMSGYEVCRRLKHDPHTRHIPVIFLSAKVQLTEVDKGLDLGAAAYILKPFSTRDLASQISRVLTAATSAN